MVVISRKERDKLIRKEDILNAAVQLFATKGYYNTSMSDIAEMSQYAVGTLYLYFKNKESIYLALLENKTEELLCTVREAVGKMKTAYEKIKVLVETQLCYFRQNAEFFQILFSERQSISKTADKNFAKKQFGRIEYSWERAGEVIKQAQEEGCVDKGLPAQKIARILFGMIHSSIFSYMQDKQYGYESARIESNLILKIFFGGVGVKK